MNREIKFRAWIGDRSVMRDVVTYQKHVKGFSISYLESMGIELEPMYSVTHSIKLMQYTGLKDKCGIEIYEGDIVLYAGYTLTIGWESSDASYLTFGGVMESGQEWGGECEVIGNIYENKELLDDEK